jgi:hypothetical protein
MAHGERAVAQALLEELVARPLAHRLAIDSVPRFVARLER